MLKLPKPAAIAMQATLGIALSARGRFQPSPRQRTRQRRARPLLGFKRVILSGYVRAGRR